MSSIDIEGIDKLFAKLDRAQAISTLRPPMQRSVYRLQRDMAQYPPARPGSSYIRTGTLGRRWTTQVTETADGLTGKTGNNTSYGPFVQSQMFQAAVHQGRWQTDQQVMDRNRESIQADFERTIQRELDR
jgi:hypothetical protein